MSQRKIKQQMDVRLPPPLRGPFPRRLPSPLTLRPRAGSLLQGQSTCPALPNPFLPFSGLCFYQTRLSPQVLSHQHFNVLKFLPMLKQQTLKRPQFSLISTQPSGYHHSLSLPPTSQTAQRSCLISAKVPKTPVGLKPTGVACLYPGNLLQWLGSVDRHILGCGVFSCFYFHLSGGTSFGSFTSSPFFGSL